MSPQVRFIDHLKNRGNYGKGCDDCKILSRKNNEDVIMECKCKDNDNRGKINLCKYPPPPLSDECRPCYHMGSLGLESGLVTDLLSAQGIWQYNGRLGCYREEGGLVPISPVKKKRSNEPDTFTLPYPVGQTFDDVPQSVEQRTVKLPFPVGQTADKIPHPVEQPGDGSAHGPPSTPDTPDVYIDVTNERRSEEPRALEFPRDENAPFGDEDSREEPAYDDGNGKRGRSFRQF